MTTNTKGSCGGTPRVGKKGDRKGTGRRQKNNGKNFAELL